MLVVVRVVSSGTSTRIVFVDVYLSAFDLIVGANDPIIIALEWFTVTPPGRRGVESSENPSNKSHVMTSRRRDQPHFCPRMNKWCNRSVIIALFGLLLAAMISPCRCYLSVLRSCTTFETLSPANARWNHVRRPLLLSTHRFSTQTTKQSASTVPNLAVLERFSVAPMMDYTDRYMRSFLRLFTRQTVLYTEMVTGMALVHTKELDRHLKFDSQQHPVILQVGGADAGILANAVELAKSYNYDAINLNCGCPSSKVANSGCFGAALMRESALVAEICKSMHDRINPENSSRITPITVKSRIGVDDQDSYEFVRDFIGTVGATGVVSHFIIHSRKAILNANLSAEQNRKIPPINYDVVYKLVKEFPQYSFVLNGQVKTYEEVQMHLDNGVAGVMVGRDIVDRPFYWANVDSKIYGTEDPGMRLDIAHVSYC